MNGHDSQVDPAGNANRSRRAKSRAGEHWTAVGFALLFVLIALGATWIAVSVLTPERVAEAARPAGSQTAAIVAILIGGAIAVYFVVRGAHHREGRLLRELRTTESMLLTSQKLEAFGILAAGMAHDFNNTLGVIRGMADLARLESYDPRVSRSAMDAIQLATFRAEDNVRHMVEFLTKPRDQFALRDVNVVTREFSPILRQAAGSRTIVAYDLEDGLPATFMSRSMIEQALLNLVINARDAVDRADPPRITISTKTVELIEQVTLLSPKPVSGSYVELSVTDNGCGIPPEDLARVFDPFFTTKQEGSGLGLPTVMRAVEIHGGLVDVRSNVGIGTCVRLLIPIRGGDRSEVSSNPLPVPAIGG